MRGQRSAPSALILTGDPKAIGDIVVMPLSQSNNWPKCGGLPYSLDRRSFSELSKDEIAGVQ
jgi:hypothetical protein